MSAFAPRSASQAGAPPTQSNLDILHSTFVANAKPAPSQEYEKLCRIVLQRRLRNLFGLSALAASAALAIAIFDPKELPASLFNIVPLVLFTPFAFLGTLPVLVLRKRTLTTVRPPLPTLFARFSSLRTRTSTVPVLIAYLTAVAFLHAAYIWAANWASGNAQLGLFFFHQGRDAYQLNERRVVLSLLHVALALWATVQHVTQDRSQVVFDDESSATIPTRLAIRGKPRLIAAFGSATKAWVAFWSAYVLFRRPVLRFFLAHVLPVWTRTHLFSMMRYNGAMSLTLALRAFSSTLFVFLVLQATHVLFEVYATQPMSVSQFGSSPNQVLLSGLRSSDPYFQQFAFLELATLTLRNASRRQAIFKDVRPGSTTAGAWAEISRECLLLLGTELQRAKGRGRLPTGSASSSSYASSSPSSTGQASDRPQGTNRAAIKSGDVFQPTRLSLFDKVAAAATSSTSTSLGSSPAAQSTTAALTSGVAAQRAQQAASTALNAAGSAVSRVPAVLQSSALVPTAVADAAVAARKAAESAPAAANVADVIGVEHSVARFVPAFLRGGVFDVAIEYRVTNCVKRRHEVVCAIQALSNLVCASLTEDPYGVAQRDIPKILEAFVRFLSVIKSLRGELEGLADQVPGGREEKERARKLVQLEVGEVEEALQAGAKAILTEFAEYLGEFRFPTQIAAQLQLLVDWGG